MSTADLLYKAQTERDELLEVCKVVLAELDTPRGIGEWMGKFLAVQLRAVIAKVEGR